MSDVAAMLREFHETYDLPARTTPTFPPTDEAGLRLDLQCEETRELIDAVADGDLLGVADALADIVYVAYGTALSFGIDLDVVLAEVHRSNMSKLGADGQPIRRHDGKVLNGPGFSPPDIAAALGAAA